MEQSRRTFFKQAFGCAALLGLGEGQLREVIPDLFEQIRIKGMGVEEGVVQLIWNENPLGPSPKAIDAVMAGLHAGNRYHDPDDLEKTIAKHHGIDVKYVIKGVGATEILYNVPIAFLKEGENMIMADPTYMTAGRVARFCGAEVRAIPLTTKYEHDLEAFLSRIDSKTRLIMICHPNNPTGTITPNEKIERFLKKVPDNILVLIDEAYFDYVEDPRYGSFDKEVTKRKNLIVVRTFSKIYGLAGLRIGYAIADEKIIKMMRRFNLRGLTNLVAHHAGPAALLDHAFIESSKRVVSEGKIYFQYEFNALGFSFPRSETNHIWVDLKQPTNPLIDAMREKKIYVRRGTDWKKPTFMRISMGTEQENGMMMETLKTLL